MSCATLGFFSWLMLVDLCGHLQQMKETNLPTCNLISREDGHASGQLTQRLLRLLHIRSTHAKCGYPASDLKLAGIAPFSAKMICIRAELKPEYSSTESWRPQGWADNSAVNFPIDENFCSRGHAIAKRRVDHV